MGKRTQPAAGVGVQASRERYAEITSGRAILQQGLTTTCKDPLEEGNQRQWEEFGLAHELV